MNRFILPILAMGFTTPVYAQSALDALSGPALSDWQGFNVAGEVNFIQSGDLTFFGPPDVSGDLDAELFGISLGYRHQVGNLVFGGAFDVVGGDGDFSADLAGMSIIDDGDTSNRNLRLGGEVGYAFGRFLPYATAGIARFTFLDTETAGDNAGSGTFFGAGLDYQTGVFGSVGIEVLRQEFDGFDSGPDLDVEYTSIGVNFRLRY